MSQKNRGLRSCLAAPPASVSRASGSGAVISGQKMKAEEWVYSPAFRDSRNIISSEVSDHQILSSIRSQPLLAEAGLVKRRPWLPVSRMTTNGPF
jgi:hypothetical protein